MTKLILGIIIAILIVFVFAVYLVISTSTTSASTTAQQAAADAAAAQKAAQDAAQKAALAQQQQQASQDAAQKAAAALQTTPTPSATTGTSTPTPSPVSTITGSSSMPSLTATPVAPPAPPAQKCCWNRAIQSCNVDSDCDGLSAVEIAAGTKACQTSPANTVTYGKYNCNTCASQGLVYNPSSGTCVSSVPTPAPAPAPVMQNKCQWLSNSTYTWVDMPQITNQATCTAMNQCASGGACYQWV